MKRTTTILSLILLAAMALGGPVLASSHGSQQTTYELDLDTDGAGAAQSTGEAVTVEVDADGDALVQDNPGAPDRTVSSSPQDVNVYVNLSNGQEYELTALVTGQGASFLATGVDGWALYIAGTDTGSVQFYGNFTLTGSNGEYSVTGNAILNVPDGNETTTYRFGVTGDASFAPSS